MSVISKKEKLIKYIKQNEQVILPHWEDEELKRKTGIADLFGDNVTIKTELNYEPI